MFESQPRIEVDKFELGEMCHRLEQTMSIEDIAEKVNRSPGNVRRLIQNYHDKSKPGTAEQIGQVEHLTYCGSDSKLKGKTALVFENGAAQFDDRNTGYGFGWHQFKREDFK